MSERSILFMVAHRLGRSPSQRFRFEQYLDVLKENGFKYEISHLIDAEDDSYFYEPGHYWQKFKILVKSFVRRLKDVRRMKQFDLVFVQREAFMTGTAIFEKLAARNSKLIFDFDDAIWLNDTSFGNQNLSWLKRPGKTAEIISVSSLVLAGNEYLANFARKFSNNVEVIPTTIDMEYHVGIERKLATRSPITIGWTGTSTTLPHFLTILPVLRRLKTAYGNEVAFKIIVNEDRYFPEISTHTTAWSKESEIEDLNEIDIGLMPLKNTEWQQGKCGFKALQFMALGLPIVLSPVGVNSEIAQHEVTGYLVNDEQEWFDAISQLIDDKDLRERMGVAGKRRIEQLYSKQALTDKFIALLTST